MGKASVAPSERPWTRESGQPSQRKHAKSIPIVVVVIALVVTSMALPVIAGVALTTTSGNARLRESTRSSAAVQSVGIAQTLKERLEIAERIALQLADQFKLVLNSSDFEYSRYFMMAALRSMARCSAVYITTPDGFLNGVVQLPDGSDALWVSFPNYTTCQLPVNSEMVVNGPPDWCSYPYFANDSVWYRAVDSTIPGDTSWTPLYWSHEVYVTFSVSAYVDGSFIGVTGVDWILGSISQLLEGIDTSGIGVLMERDSEMFLGSTDASLNAGGVNQTTGEVIIHNMSQIAGDNALISSAQAAVMSTYGSWDLAANKTFWSKDGTIISITPIDRNGLKWLLAVISQPSFIVVDPAALGTVLGITAVLIIIAVVGSWMFAKPINDLSSDMAAISQLEFGARRTKQGLSRLREIRDIQKSFLRLRTGTRALTRYVPSEVVLDVMRSDTGDLKLDMKLSPLTILFTDLKGFTSMSEMLPHDILITILNRWFQEFGKVIQANGGTIDKFIGDNIMVLYGAPQPIENPELAACRTALGFKQAMEVVNGYAAMHEIPPLDYRVGLHTGQVLVGHLGYSEHVNYTVCGSAANVASRMEQLGKEYGLTPLVSGDVAEKVKNEFLCVFLDVIFLRGHKTIRTHVFHLLVSKSLASSTDEAVASTFDAIHAAVRSGDSAGALRRVEEAQAKPELGAYHTALRNLHDHIRSGATNADSYSEQLGACQVDFDVTTL